jgi:hypothetical protein
MNKSDFFLNLIEYSQTEGFYFLGPDETATQPRIMSEGRQKVFRMVSGTGFGISGLGPGIFGWLSTGYFDVPDRRQLQADLRRMNELCDIVGINLTNGPVVLRLALDTDGVDDDTIVSLFPRIHELTHDFQQYGFSIVKNKMSARSQVLLAFSSHTRAMAFRATHAPKCKQSSFWRKIYTEAWVVDLEAAEITRFRHGGEFMARDLEKRKAGFFRQRS